MGVTFLFSVISGADPMLISEIVRQVVSTVFDRSQESEADAYGLNYLKTAKSTQYMATFLEVKRRVWRL